MVLETHITRARRNRILKCFMCRVALCSCTVCAPRSPRLVTIKSGRRNCHTQRVDTNPLQDPRSSCATPKSPHNENTRHNTKLQARHITNVGHRAASPLHLYMPLQNRPRWPATLPKIMCALRKGRLDPVTKPHGTTVLKMHSPAPASRSKARQPDICMAHK